MTRDSYLLINGADFDHGTGRQLGESEWESTGDAGHLLFGPYRELIIGNYAAAIFMKKQSRAKQNGSIRIDVCSHNGTIILFDASMHANALTVDYDPIFIEFQVTASDPIEVRVFVPQNVFVSCQKVIIFKKYL